MASNFFTVQLWTFSFKINSMILLKGLAKNDLELKRNHIMYHGHIKRIQF